MMPAKPNRRARTAEFRSRDEAVADDDMERFLAEHHDEVAKKLNKARASIARGEAKPLEPLSELLREARKRSKSSR